MRISDWSSDVCSSDLDVIGFGIIMPVLPELITHLGHVDLEEATRVAGWLLAVFAIAQFVAGPIVGNLGDRFGRRPILIISMVAFAIDYAIKIGRESCRERVCQYV